MNKKTETNNSIKETSIFSIKYPLIWLAAAVLILYWPSLKFDFTELDDSIFIRELSFYNEDLTNLITSFKRGVFHATNDTYYRPLFLDSMILNYQLSDKNIEGYHLINLLLHLSCVLLLFRLFRKIGVNNNNSFLLSLIFAVHPVLSQAVAWIPGRNDTLMALFILPYLSSSIDYAEHQKPLSLGISLLLLTAAMFTKETALLAPVAAWIILVFIKKNKMWSKQMLVQYGIWLASGLIYLWVRSGATLKQNPMNPGNMMHDFVRRIPLLVQYLGKILLPFNLSVFPIMDDTVYYFGFAAIAIIVAIVFLAKHRNNNIVWGGLALFFIFLLPVLFVPNNINEQTFEHRLYLPIIGILLILSQSILFQNTLETKKLTGIIIGIAFVFAFINYKHQDHFKDPLSFWGQAAETSPHSAYALMMYGARIKDDNALRNEYIEKAYQLNPDEKYLNYYYALMLQEKDSMEASAKHLLKEQKISDYYECDFYLAKVDFSRKDFNQAAKHLERYVSRDTLSEPGNNNLLLLYVELKEKAKGLKHISDMKRRGLIVSPAVQQQIENLP